MLVLSFLKAIFCLYVLIIVHEMGHLLVAKLLYVSVEEFAVGFGRKLYSITRGETTYSIRSIPFGGFVKPKGLMEHSTMVLIAISGPIVSVFFGLLVILVADLLVDNSGMTFNNIFGIYTGAKFIGPIGVIKIIMDLEGLPRNIFFIGMLSFLTGLMNLIPIPPLDGGRIFMKNLEIQKQTTVNAVGGCLILAVIIGSVISDITCILR